VLDPAYVFKGGGGVGADPAVDQGMRNALVGETCRPAR
jgi:hypothetical protein